MFGAFEKKTTSGKSSNNFGQNKGLWGSKTWNYTPAVPNKIQHFDGIYPGKMGIIMGKLLVSGRAKNHQTLSLETSQKREKVKIHQHVQVPKMEGFLNLIAGHFGDRFSLTCLP